MQVCPEKIEHRVEGINGEKYGTVTETYLKKKIFRYPTLKFEHFQTVLASKQIIKLTKENATKGWMSYLDVKNCVAAIDDIKRVRRIFFLGAISYFKFN